MTCFLKFFVDQFRHESDFKLRTIYFRKKFLKVRTTTSLWALNYFFNVVCVLVCVEAYIYFINRRTMKKLIDSSVLDGAKARNFRQFNSEATIQLVVEFKCGNNRYVEGQKRHLRMSKGKVGLH